MVTLAQVIMKRAKYRRGKFAVVKCRAFIRILQYSVKWPGAACGEKCEFKSLPNILSYQQRLLWEVRQVAYVQPVRAVFVSVTKQTTEITKWVMVRDVYVTVIWMTVTSPLASEKFRILRVCVGSHIKQQVLSAPPTHSAIPVWIPTQ
jgi:hypothetical protein